MSAKLHPEVHRGDIFYADLGIKLGSEQDGRRPVLIIPTAEEDIQAEVHRLLFRNLEKSLSFWISFFVLPRYLWDMPVLSEICWASV